MNNITVKSSITIIQAMKSLQEVSEKCLLIVDEDNKLLGTLTDGDLRRSILAGSQFSDEISKVFNQNPISLKEGMFDMEKAHSILLDQKIDLIPIVNEAKEVVDYITWYTLGKAEESVNTLSDVPVAIMAGGIGTRLEPFTKILPKPLVPIHNKPIIDHIIERFLTFGCKDFFMTVNYKSRILKAYFEESDPRYNISFIEEKIPLGTVGGLKLIENSLTTPIFLTNCDVIIKANYQNIFNFHQNGKFDITLVASAKDYVIPYGTCEINKDGSLKKINEKPNYDLLINTGLYVINHKSLHKIPQNTFFHITDLIDLLIKENKSIGVFPVHDDDWIDIGQWSEYKQALKNF